MQRDFFKNDGFSMVEILVTVIIAMITLLAVYTVFNQQHTAATVQNYVGQMNQNGRNSLNLLQNAIANAGGDRNLFFAGYNVVPGIDTGLAVMQFDGDARLTDQNPDQFVPKATTPAGIPLAKAKSDVVVTTFPFGAENPARNNAVESICPAVSNLTFDGTSKYSRCIDTTQGDKKCQLLVDLILLTDPAGSNAWWQTINQTDLEPLLLLQQPDQDASNRVAVQTLAIKAITVTPGSICPTGSLGNLLTIEIEGPAKGFQVQPQRADGAVYTANPVPGSAITGSIVSSYLFYLTSEHRLVSIKMGHDQTTHDPVSLVREIAFDLESFQLRFEDRNGNLGEDIGNIDGDLLKDVQTLAAVHVGMVLRTQNPNPERQGQTQKSEYVNLFNDDTDPNSSADSTLANTAFHRRVLLRKNSADNLRYF